jgi:hypothetical protein
LLGKHSGLVGWGFIFIVIPAAVMDYSKAGNSTSNYLLCFAMFAGIAFMAWLLFRSANYVASTKIFQRSHYETSKKWIAVVKANGMMVPAPFTKEGYYAAERYVQWYENAYPAENEPYRVWITQEQMCGFIIKNKKKGRQPSY